MGDRIKFISFLAIWTLSASAKQEFCAKQVNNIIKDPFVSFHDDYGTFEKPLVNKNIGSGGTIIGSTNKFPYFLVFPKSADGRSSMTVTVDEKTITYPFKLNEKLQNRTHISFDFLPDCEIDGIRVLPESGSSVFISNLNCYTNKLDNDINCMGKSLTKMQKDQQQKCIRYENILGICNKYGIKTTLKKPAKPEKAVDVTPPGRTL